MQRVEGVIQHYAWGDPDFLPRLFGIEPDGRPWAEYWLGTHPSGPSSLVGGSRLADLTGELPFLLKVLAAADPLSLQTHPDAEQARDGFDRGIYPDPSAKPELLCALTPFEALCGIRPLDATSALFDELGIVDLARVLMTDGPAAALAALYDGSVATEPVIAACQHADRPEAEWVRRLAARYPGDPGVAVTLLLNHVVLAPGQALRLDAGNLHAYLHGAGIELMGPSDNVIRGGLTSKSVDVDELLRIVDLAPLEQPVLADAERYELRDAGVALVKLEPGDVHVAGGHELAVDLNGDSWYFAPGELVEVEQTTFVVVAI